MYIYIYICIYIGAMQHISLVSTGPTGAEVTGGASPLSASADESSSVERQKWEKVFEGQEEEGAHNLSTCGFWEEGSKDGSEKWEAVKDTCALKVAIRIEGGPWVFERCDILSDQGVPMMLDDAEDDTQDDVAAGAQFTCFTSAKVQILTQMIQKSATYRNPPT